MHLELGEGGGGGGGENFCNCRLTAVNADFRS